MPLKTIFIYIPARIQKASRSPDVLSRIGRVENLFRARVSIQPVGQTHYTPYDIEPEDMTAASFQAVVGWDCLMEMGRMVGRCCRQSSRR